METTKICSKCGKEKPLSEFYRNTRNKDGYRYCCKECCSKISAKYREDNREILNKRSAQWYLEHKNNSHEHHLQDTYGISLTEYDEMLDAQGGVCFICGKSPEENGRRLSVDHDHKTGKNRKLLCHCCNIGLGGFGDDPRLLRIAIDYLEMYK